MKLPSMYKIYGMYQNLTEIIIVFNNIVEYKINKLLVGVFQHINNEQLGTEILRNKPNIYVKYMYI